ncbi:MAG: hypothetical protein AB1430_24450 [Pseudomonadota bacterium]
MAEALILEAALAGETPTATTLKPQARPSSLPGLAPFALLRAAALPLQMLEDLRLRATEARIELILEAERRLGVCRQPVADALFAVVSRLAADDALMRRQVLALRRDVHNGRAITVAPALADRVRALLACEDERQQFEHWLQAQQQLTTALGALEAGVREELQRVVRPALRRLRERGTFRRALAFASPGVERNAAREKRLPDAPAPDKLERALLGYLARAAAKTSPFSSFMSLSVLRLDPAREAPLPRAQAVEYLSTVRLNRGLVSRLHRLGVAHGARADDLVLAVNPTLRPGANERVHGLCSREVVLLGRPWWEQRFAQFRLEPALWQALQAQARAPWSHWVQRLRACGLGEAAAEATLLKLLERGLLMPPDLIDAFDEAPLDRVIAQWQASASAPLRERVPALQALRAQTEAIAASEGEERIGLLDAVGATAQALQQGFGGPAAEPLQNLVSEDCWAEGVQGVAGAALLQPLADLQSFLSGQVIESGYYRRMRDHFVARFGEGGVCTDAVDFLLKVSDKLVDIPEFGAQWKGELPVAARPGVQVPVTAQVQIAAAPGAAPCVVVNRVFDGAGWLAARFTSGPHAGPRELRAQLQRWLQRVSGHREPVDVPIGGHCSDLQAHQRLTKRVLRWPGEPLTLPQEQVIEASALRIRHEPRSGLLEVTDGEGTPLNLMYLGTTFPSPIWGLRYALSILTQPYLIARPDFPPPADQRADEVRLEPRMMHGALVLRRATWWMPIAHLRRHWFDGTPGQRLLKVRRDCDRLQLPPVFFAQRHIPSDRSKLIASNVLEANRKPIWIDTRNPFWLAILERLAEEGEWITFTEPLPGPQDLWLQMDGQAHVSELQIEMLVEAGTPNSTLTQGAAA